MSAARDLRREARRLGRAVNGHPEEVAAAVPRLAEILDACAGDTYVTRNAVDALGHAWHASAAEVLLTRVPVDHPSSEVRLSLAKALPCGVVDAGPVRDGVIEALATLLDDEHARVRDWAAFGLGQVEADTPAVRDALAELLNDPDTDARCEALLALARTGDSRSCGALLHRLQGDGDDLRLLELQAAGILADPALHPELERLAQEWGGDMDDFTEPLRLALARCRPDAHRQASAVERLVVTAALGVLPPGTAASVDGSYPRSTLVVALPDALGPEMFALWTEHEDPWSYPTRDVVNAVQGTLAERLNR